MSSPSSARSDGLSYPAKHLFAWGLDEGVTLGVAVTAHADQAHALRKAVGQTASVLVLFVPGVDRHLYFAEVGALAVDASEATLMDLHRRYDNDFGLSPDNADDASVQ